jgi:hypothetical protein
MDGTKIEKLSDEIEKIFIIDYANPRESYLKRADSASTLTREHEAGGDG